MITISGQENLLTYLELPNKQYWFQKIVIA